MMGEWSRGNRGTGEQGNRGVRELGIFTTNYHERHKQEKRELFLIYGITALSIWLPPDNHARFAISSRAARERGSQSVYTSSSFWDRH